MGIFELISVIHYRKAILAWSICVCVAVAIFTGMILPKKFSSTAKVQVDSVQRNTLTGLVEPRVKIAEFLGQQAAIATSRSVAIDVFDALEAEGFLAMADFETQWREETGGELLAGNDARLWAADQFLENLFVEADALESTLEIGFRADDPSQAARVANAFANEYMEKIQDEKQRRSAQKALSFTEETRSLAEDVEEAQRDLANFRKDSGILPLGVQQIEATEVELASLSGRLASARADNSEAQSLLRKARSTPSSSLVNFPLPEDSIPGRQAQVRLGAVNAQLARIKERYGENYPDYLETLREKKALEDNILQAMTARADYSRRRVAALSSAVAEMKKEVTDLQGTRQAYDLLKDKVNASQETFNLVATRSLQESLQSRIGSIDVLLLARAVPPVNPSTPPLAVIGIIGFVFGGLLGISVAVFAELYEGKVRNVRSVQQVFRTKIVSEVTAVEKPKRRSKKPNRQKLRAAA